MGSAETDHVSSPAPEVLALALDRWHRVGRTNDAFTVLLDHVLEQTAAERVFLVRTSADGPYRIRATRNADGEAIPDAEASVSHFAVQRALATEEWTFFADTRADRRFRTEGEREHGAKVRSILVVPLESGERSTFLYLDARFRDMNGSPDRAEQLQSVFDLLALFAKLDRAEHQAKTIERRFERKFERLRRSHGAQAGGRRPVVKVSENVEREIDFHGFRTRSPELIAHIAELEKLSKSDLSVLIEGESGTGKEVLARAVHEESGRRGRFVSLHCGAVPDSLVEIELFGYDRGAFTGADKSRGGLIELARGGTLFFDDIGEMPDEMQNALLRVLETRSYRAVSGAEEKPVDIRVISAGLTGPTGESASAALREDLYFRLAGARISIPPLRARGEDIILLGRMFYARHRRDQDPPTISPEVEAAMLAYHWPGNSRELENLFRRMIALGADRLDLARFEEITGFRTGEAVATSPGTDVRSVVERAEREVILRALRECDGNKSLAAKTLGLSRKTLYRRMEKHGIPL